MAANWNNPHITSLYMDFLNELKARDVDVLRMDPGTTGAPSGAKRFNSALSVFQEWNGSAWNTLVLSAAGGGTGVSSGFPSLGTMATQNSNAVAITGGSITGVGLNASDITSGIVALARGGIGASLSLAANGNFLQSNGSQVVFGANGGLLYNLVANNITNGNLPIAQMPVGGDWNISGAGWVRVNGAFISGAGLSNMGPGTINAAAYYLNNAPLSTGGGSIPSGMMAYFQAGCPAGWTFVAGSQARTIRSTAAGGGITFGTETHIHDFSVPAGGGGDINSGGPSPSRTGDETPSGNSRSYDSGSSFSGWQLQTGTHSHDMNHSHNFNVPGFPGHVGNTGVADNWPPAIEFSLCRKD